MINRANRVFLHDATSAVLNLEAAFPAYSLDFTLEQSLQPRIRAVQRKLQA
jgi:hypothetical protein